MNLGQAIAGYIKFERFFRDVAASSAALYAHHLNAFSAFAATQDLRAAGKRIVPYLIHLGEREVSESYRVKAKVTLRAFGRWLIEEGQLADWPLRRVRIKQPRRTAQPFLTQDEAVALFRAAAMRGGMHAERDLAMIATMYGCGLRVSECCGALASDLDVAGAALRVLGKGAAVLWVPVPAALLEILTAYLRERAPGAALLFPARARFSRKFGRLDLWRVNRILRAVAAEAGINKHVSSHILRRSAAQHMRRHPSAPAPLDAVKDFLRHRLITTTMLYLQENDVEAVRPWSEKLRYR